MLDQALDGYGNPVDPEAAVRIRDESDTPVVFTDPRTGETVFVRRGHNTSLSHAKPHFYHPGEVEERDVGREKQIAAESLAGILWASGFYNVRAGILGYTDNRVAMTSDIVSPDFDLGFHVVTAQQAGQQYGFVVVNRVPNSDEFLSMLRTANNNQRADSSSRIALMLHDYQQGKSDLDQRLHMAVVQVKNDHLFRPNYDHPDFLMLGDWQAYHLLALGNGAPAFTFIDGDMLELASLVQVPHECDYSNHRHGYKGQDVPSSGSLFCRKAQVTRVGAIGVDTYQLAKDSLSRAIGKHPRLYLAAPTPQAQLSLF